MGLLAHSVGAVFRSAGTKIVEHLSICSRFCSIECLDLLVFFPKSLNMTSGALKNPLLLFKY
jgi:hypothetical protein